MTAPIRREALRFLIAGAINTAVTYAIYLTMLVWLNYTLAYTIAYVIGIALAYVLGTRFVFRVQRSARGMLLFPLVYLAQYLLGVMTLRLAVDIFSIPQKYAMLVSIAVTVPVTFLLSRATLKPRSQRTAYDFATSFIDWRSRQMRSAYFGAALLLLGFLYIGVNTLPTRLIVDMVVDESDIAQLFYSHDGIWSEAESVVTPLKPGWNRIILSIPSLQIGSNMRFDPGRRATTYRILAMRWERSGVSQAVALDELANPRSKVSTLSVADGQLMLTCTDDDAQLIVPTPGWKWSLTSLSSLFGPLLIGLLLLYAGIRLKVSEVHIAAVFLGACALFYFFACLGLGPRLPLDDDWRYLCPGRFDLIDGDWQWLTAVTNDTYFLTNQLLDFSVLKLSNVDFFWLRAVAVALLMLQLALQYRIVSRVAHAQPFIAAIGISLGIWSLARGAYWGATAVAYQQALPTLFGTLMIGLLIARDGSFRSGFSITLILLCCLGSGLSYVSGGLLICALGTACLLAAYWRPLSCAIARVGWIMIASGVVLLALQIALVTQQQGSLLEHNHAAASVYPNDWRFWVFFFSLYGRALGYTGQSSLIDALLAALILFPACLLCIERVAMTRSHLAYPQRTWVMLALYAGIGSAMYAAAVAFGRAGFTPVNSSISAVVSAGKSRFHYWPIAALLPYVWLGWAHIAQRLRHGANVLTATVAALMLVPKSLLAFAHISYLISVEKTAQSGSQCVVSHLADVDAGRPVVCIDLTGVAIDIGPTLRHLRALHSPVYYALMQEGSSVTRDSSGMMSTNPRDGIFRTDFAWAK